MSNDLSPRAVAESYWRVECERDLAKILAHYHEDAVMQPPGQVLRGHEQIRTFYEDSIRRFPILEVAIVHEVRQGNEAALEWQAAVTDQAGHRYPFNGVNIICVEDGKFRSVHAYFDPSVLPSA
jgi:ketosteroid isomerase-like protein